MHGSYYEGQWKNGRQHGLGKLYTNSGLYYEGGFNQGVASCADGFIVLPDGSTYRGSFENNAFNGKGKFTYRLQTLSNRSNAAPQEHVLKEKSYYEGDWVDNLPHGKGKEFFEDGSTYQGQFQKGKKNGEGVFRWSNGKVYKGTFANGQIHGRGRLFIADAKEKENKLIALFEGNFVNGLKELDGGQQGSNNKGQIKTPYGTYIGTLKYGQLYDSYGKFIWKDGKKYQGGFQLGQIHGEGTVTFPKYRKLNNGQWQLLPNQYHVIKGEWNRGQNVSISAITSTQ